MRLERALAAIVALFVVGAAQAALYKYVDEKGRVQYSDKPPTEKDKGGVQMSNRGIVLKKLDTGMTADQKKATEEDLARKKQEEAKAAEQRRQDNALLHSFSSVQEIDMKRDREVQSIEAMIGNLREQQRAVGARLADERKRLEHHAKRSQPAPDALKEDIQRNESQMKVIREEIDRRYQEIVATRAKYETLRRRYQELREQELSGAMPAPTASAQAPTKK